MKNIYKLISISAILSLPILVNAQYLTGTTGIFEDILDLVETILIPLAFTCALLFFFWGVAKYIRSAGNEKEEGKKIMVWGVVALFVMSTIWGLVAFIGGEFNLNTTTEGVIPTIK